MSIIISMTFLYPSNCRFSARSRNFSFDIFKLSSVVIFLILPLQIPIFYLFFLHCMPFKFHQQKFFFKRVVTLGTFLPDINVTGIFNRSRVSSCIATQAVALTQVCRRRWICSYLFWWRFSIRSVQDVSTAMVSRHLQC